MLKPEAFVIVNPYAAEGIEPDRVATNNASVQASIGDVQAFMQDIPL